MVPRAGLEPATLGLEVLCSIQLSYRGVPCSYCNKKHPVAGMLIWCGLVEVFRTKYYQYIVKIAKEISISKQYLTV